MARDLTGASVSDFGRAVFAWFDAKVDELSDESRKAVKETARDGEDATREYIATRGIRKPGRVDTSDMINSVDSRVEQETDDEIVASFGFYDAPGYTPFQELGTRAIAPMYALTDAADEARENLKKRVGQAVKRS